MTTLAYSLNYIIDHCFTDESRTKRAQRLATHLGIGRTHLYEIIKGTRELQSFQAIRVLYWHYDIPLHLILPPLTSR